MEQKARTITYWIITGIFVVFMSFGAVSELLQVESAQKVLTDLGYPTYVNYILGVAKLIGAVALVQWRFKAFKEWAYAGFSIDIVAAAASNFFVVGITPALITLVFLIPLGFSYYMWKTRDAN